MKMASRLIDLISKKPNCMCSTLFLLISKKQICTCSTLFCLSLAVVLHHYNAVLYNCHVCFYFSPLLIFTSVAASISHFLTAALNFHVFLPMKFASLVFSRGGGVLPYNGLHRYGMCFREGYGFQEVYFRIGYIIQSVWV